MKNTFGQHVSVTLFGESHGPAIGAVLDGLCPGTPIDMDNIRRMLQLRQPGGAISTARKEADEVQILSGAVDGIATGTPLTLVIFNKDTKSGDYADMARLMRPGHADYPAQCKYHGYQDTRGGGHFSGRITAALVAAGAVCHSALEKKGIFIGTHIFRCAGVPDRKFGDLKADIQELSKSLFPTLDEVAADFGDTQFVMCHFGNPFLESAAAVLAKNPNVSTDLSGLLEGPLDLRQYMRDQTGYVFLLRTWLAASNCWNRILFGTDWPIVNLGDYIRFIRQLVPEPHWDAVFFENANRIYGLGL